MSKGWRRGSATFLEIVRSEAGALCDAGEHFWTNFFALMEAKHEAAKLWMGEFYVGAFLRGDAPAFSKERPENKIRFGTGPAAQAGMWTILIVSGIFLDFSTSSATA